jgi:hypothetical protein
MPRETHVVEDIYDKEEGHASVDLEQQPLLQLLPHLASTKLSIWVHDSCEASVAVVTFRFSRVF